MSNEFSLIDFKALSEPITKLIESVSKGIGSFYEPIGKIRNAKADVKIAKLLAKAEVAKSVEERASLRVEHKEVRRQENIDAIVIGAIELLPDEVSKVAVDEDWIVQFFDLGQDVGNSEMQKIWSKLLAGEVSLPNSFSPRTLQAVKFLTADDANAFTLLCSFSFQEAGGDWIFPASIFSHECFEYIRAKGLSAIDENHLKSIGLLSTAEIWYRPPDDGAIELSYYSEDYFLNFDEDEKGVDAYLEAYTFTAIGKELATIAGGVPDKEFIKMMIDSGVLVPFPIEKNG
ncbi:DUF2806 domain-containing protein [Pseudomonas fluorescens]|uniref:DUF2806 domain-containing protein n=1 Tax=Pseudomonas fluorescens TaxID=294 RepID=A0A423LMZ9_PSEFL|nr:DUF2806 domain-containing protein [Pseudomonas fluorescens]RON69712.1 hypothetical protein BK671_09890 [Pseudomonas fluorescens]